MPKYGRVIVEYQNLNSKPGEDMIQDYAFGRIVVEGKEYTNDLIIYPDRIDDDWWRQEGHRLQMVDLQGISAANPEVLIVGTGAYGAMQVDPKVKQSLAEQKISLVALPTDQACQKYNELVNFKRIVAALHLTC
ncbi:MAG: hypothetical protein GTN69_01195 [Armatimonadetes bacterium]|nr:hypothetical protein [Armatimonadota bacterium]NIO74521.1 hypothetical protein [Armatimonadota bacterium]NIO98350.1 hypothetical protein [Armatimonadota bacterium]